ncbi:1-acyl-sn-glycerol-3-phosphate acyltransferase BAT2, chloroplastic [Linum perenne]
MFAWNGRLCECLIANELAGYGRSSCSAVSRSLPFSSYIGPYSVKLPTLMSTTTSALSCFSCISRKHSAIPWCSYSEELFNRSYPSGSKPWTPNKPSIRTAVRSELAGSGNTDVNPSSEISLISRVRGFGFYTVTAIAAMCLIVVMLAQHPFVLSLDRYRRKAHHFIASLWARIAVTPFLNIEFEGMENLPPADSPAVYVSNHQSFLDIYTLLTMGRSFKFISKTSIFLYPIIGWAMSMLGTIPLKRMDSRSQLECLKRCIDLVNKGASVFFFPEGTRSKDGKLGPFKKGAFSIAAKTGVPVVPMTIIGTGGIMPTGKEAILNSGSVRVVIHEPLQGNDAAVLCDEARTVIAGPLLNNQQS